MPRVEPRYSPTMAPDRDRPRPVRRLVSSQGRQAGQMTFPRICPWVPPSRRTAPTKAGSTLWTPV